MVDYLQVFAQSKVLKGFQRSIIIQYEVSAACILPSLENVLPLADKTSQPQVCRRSSYPRPAAHVSAATLNTTKELPLKQVLLHAPYL